MGGWDWHAISVYALAALGFVDVVIRGLFGIAKTFMAELHDLKSWNKRLKE